jgi:hypothetical protein
MLVAGVAVWALALIDVGGAPRRPGSSAAESPETARPAQAASAELAEPATRTAPAAHVESRAAVGQPSSFAQLRAGEKPPLVKGGRVHLIGSRTEAVMAAHAAAAREPGAASEPEPGELGEGVLSPEFVELERSYVDEPREGPWALAHEQRVRALLRAAPVGRHVVLVSCQQTVCRIVIEPASADAFAQLTQVPGLREATGLGSATPYSLRGGQLSVYFRPIVPAEKR